MDSAICLDLKKFLELYLVPLCIRLPQLLCTSKNMYNLLIVFILYCKTLLLLLRWDMGKVRDRFGGMGRFKGGLRCKALKVLLAHFPIENG